MEPGSGERAAVTVITVVRNGARTIERAIESVRAQTHRPLEHVIVDGASTDGTVDLLRRHEGLRWISEPDDGLYDAMNKGVALVTDPDRYIHFLNADDAFPSPGSLAELMAGSGGADFVYGRVETQDEALGDRHLVGREVSRDDMLYGTKIAHQAVACRKRVFDKVGGFDRRYRLAADYDWMLRVLERNDVSVRFVPVTAVAMSWGGVSYSRYPAMARERWRIVRDRFPAFALAKFTVYTVFGDYGRHYLQRILRRVGLLPAARALKRRIWRST
jgi:glycosyltransferase involved in cell wall biosynthesis